MKISTLRDWAWHFALIVSVIVALISFFVGVSFLQMVLRSVLAYGLIYALSEVSFYLFENTSITKEQNIESNLGALLDIAVGQDEDFSQIDQDSEKGSAMGRTAPYGQTGYNGIGQAPLPGQVTHDLAQGLPDEEKQAEIVRRMGWGE